ncbi:hypothetical protein Tco_0889462, partial [Tanacetum coccineum]
MRPLALRQTRRPRSDRGKVPPRVSPPPPTQENASIDITLTFSPITPLDVQFDTPSPSPPILGHPILWNLLEAHEDS